MLSDVKPGVAIDHPLANLISIQNHKMAMGGERTSEIAFFLDREWVTETIPEFAEYTSDPPGSDTRVYGWVPNEMIREFLEKFGSIS